VFEQSEELVLDMLIKNGNIILKDRIFKGDVRIENGKIAEISDDIAIKSDLVIDATDKYVSPGFVDIHTHGGYEADFMDSTADAYNRALRFHIDNGTTTVVPTSCTSPKESIISFINFARDYINSDESYKNTVAGVHLEGPYLSVKNRGAQKLEELAIPEQDDYSYIIENADVIKTVTISPELPGAEKMTNELSGRGILVSGGHDDGIYPEFLPTIDAGMRHLTHHFCAMSDLRFKDGRRNVGLREYGLIDDRLTSEIIADNRHITPELALLIVRAKGSDKVCVVSDSLRCAGQPKDGRLYKLGTGDNADLVKIGDGIAVTVKEGIYAGSITPVRKMVKNLIDAGINIIDAVKMGTITPAKIIGEDSTVGSIEVGKRANICLLDGDFNLSGVFIDGKAI
jgi:N-acetylglucosamine-6-phosphate deacetylase